MCSNTAGYFMAPPDEDAHLYVQLEDGKWYFKEEQTCATPYIQTSSSMEEEVLQGFGDVDSKEKGSAARYNSGKPPMAYIPLEQQLAAFHAWPEMEDMWPVLYQLSRFEKGECDMLNVVTELSPADLIEASYVWGYGADKYAAWNWTKGMAWSIPLGCISRHMMAILTGEEIDPESHYSHWGHIVCNILMLDHYSRYFKAGDDLPPPEMFRVE